MDRYAVIIAGGVGERFWPMSRKNKPKHLLSILSEASMLEETIDRLSGIVDRKNIFLITSEQQKDSLNEKNLGILKNRIVYEPMGKNTGVAIAVAARLIELESSNSSFVVLPADHLIKKTQCFRHDICQCFELAESKGGLVTIGILPTFPSIGYGYIKIKDSNIDDVVQNNFEVENFVEKPKLEIAREYLSSKKYFWNAGIFVWKTKDIIIELARSMSHTWSAVCSNINDLNVENISTKLQKFYPDLKSLSIDYGVMEYAKNIFVVRASFIWDDFGTWSAVERHFESDENKNVLVGDSVVAKDSTGNIVFEKTGRTTVLFGVDDLIVVQTGDATLICSKSKAEEIKAILPFVPENLK